MSEINPKLPPEWTDRPIDDLSGAIAAFEHETSEASRFVVSINQQTSDPDQYKLQLSSIELASTPTRHDYLVEEYDDMAEAVEATQEFLRLFTNRLKDGSVSKEDPTIDDVQSVIRKFTTEYQPLSLKGLIQRLRR